MNNAEMIVINGRKYVSIREATRLASYSREYLYACCRQGKLQTVAGGKGRIYVNLSDLYRFIEQKSQWQSKWQQIGVWWRDHPRERVAIRSGTQFQQLLAQTGIRCSLGHVRAWLARHAPREHRVFEVLAWLEADPQRRRLSMAQARRELFAQLRLEVRPHTIHDAWKKFDAAHGTDALPFDPALYLTAKEAAVQFGVSRKLITHEVRQGRLNGVNWNENLYVLRSDLQQRFGQHWLKRGQATQMLREWYQAHPVYLDARLTDAQGAFYAETGIHLSTSLFCRARKWARTQANRGAGAPR